MTKMEKTIERNKGQAAGRRPRGGAGSDGVEANNRMAISSDAANLKRIIDAGFIVQARLRELSSGDVVDLAMGSVFLLESSHQRCVFEALRELRDRGLVYEREAVSRGDPSEYLLT